MTGDNARAERCGAVTALPESRPLSCYAVEMEAWIALDPRVETAPYTDAIDAHYGALVRRLTVVVGDNEAARDIAQETCLRAYRSWSTFDGRDVRAWLYTIGLRLALNEVARRKRWRALLFRAPRSEVPAWVQADDGRLHAALDALRPEHRAALWLNVVDGYSQAEIASMLGVAPGTIASWVARAKAGLRAVLADD